ncbi:glutathione S-transferase N-terminal domain-containing protein [Patescibacteria group bacterium]|nr:glutathione S-transferase N-terminal domain-containing protein [Patescibacteria group bacterium]
MGVKSYPKVILFSSGSCPWCSRAKNYLRQNGVKVKEIRVDKDPDAAKDVVRMTGQMSVPVLLIGRTKIVGFDKAKIDRLLGLKGR